MGMKRFVDTALGRKAWFRKLSPKLKCAWRFLCDECDHAGAWSIDIDALEFYVGESVSIPELMGAFNGDGEERILQHGKDKLFLTQFVEFQYGVLSPACKPHAKVIARLKELNLFDRKERVPDTLSVGSLGTLQEEEEEEEKDKEEETEKEEERGAGEIFETPPESFPVEAAAINACVITWTKSLRALGIERKVEEFERRKIGLAIQRFGAEAVELALFGARHEPPVGDFKPKDYASLKRIFEPSGKNNKIRFDEYLNWGSKARTEEAAKARKQESPLAAPGTAQRTDPSKVTELLGRFSRNAKIGGGS